MHHVPRPWKDSGKDVILRGHGHGFRDKPFPDLFTRSSLPSVRISCLNQAKEHVLVAPYDFGSWELVGLARRRFDVMKDVRAKEHGQTCRGVNLCAPEVTVDLADGY